jgi:hypothetical protein
MSDSDEGKPKEFFQVRLLKTVAEVKVRELRVQLSTFEAEYRQYQERLIELCPHLRIAECKSYFEDAGPGHDYTDIRIPARRCCTDCGLLEDEDVQGAKLFGRNPDWTLPPKEYGELIAKSSL